MTVLTPRTRRSGCPCGAWGRAVVLVSATAALLACAPTPAAAARTLRAALDGASPALPDVSAPVVALLAVVAWALTGWLLLAGVLTAGTRLPGVAGRATAALLRRVAPAALRSCLEISLGLTVATGAVAGPASASYGGAGAGPAAPRAAPAAVTPLLDWPTAATPPAAAQVVVAPGDTLWALAQRALGDHATPAEIARAWPAWWAANRDVIGADPDLLRAGAVLTPPASPPS